MNMYEFNNMHGMSVWSTNAYEEYPLSLTTGNEQASFSKSLEILQQR